MRLNNGLFTSDVRLSVLRNVFEGRNDPSHDIIRLKKRDEFLKLTISYAAYFRLDIIQILNVVSKEGLEVVLAHRLS